MSIVSVLKDDVQFQEIKQKWASFFNTNVPPYNYDEYSGIEDYKQKLLKQMESTVI